MIINRINANVAKLAAKSQSNRPEIEQVRVTHRFTEATDGHVAGRVSLPGVSRDDFPVIKGVEYKTPPETREVFIDPELLQSVTKRIPKSHPLPICQTALISANGKPGSDVQIITTDLDCHSVVDVRERDVEYPKNAEKAFRGAGKLKVESEIWLNPKKLLQIARFVADSVHRTYPTVRLRTCRDKKTGNARIYLTARNRDTGQVIDALLMAVKPDGVDDDVPEPFAE